MATIFDLIYVDPFDIGDPCERTPELWYWHASQPEIKKSLLECFEEGKKSVEKLITERLMPEEGKDEAAKRLFALIE